MKEYEPIGAHRALWGCREPRVLVEGPAGTGKTRSELERLNALAWKYPHSRHLIARKTRASMSESVLVTWERDVHAETMHLFGSTRRANRESYVYPNGSVVVVGGLDKPERTYSAEYDTIHVFEAIETTENEIEQLLRALRSGRMPYQQLVCDTNPGSERHWLNLRASSGWFRRIVTRLTDNPRFFAADGTPTYDGAQFMQSLEALTGHRRMRLLEGKWCSVEGVVYDAFDAAVHVIDKMPDGWESWRKFRSIDFGYIDPFVCQWWADSGEALYLYREIYMSHRIVEDHAKQIIELSRGEEYVATVADHAREDRETLHRYGVMTAPAEKDIDRGCDLVRSRLRIQPNGKPRIYVLNHATVEHDRTLAISKRPTSTRDEFDAYIWESRRDGAIKERPLDRDNHGMDAMRYVICAAEGIGISTPYLGVIDTWD
jgi:PBSX family phage terminase large subunit